MKRRVALAAVVMIVAYAGYQYVRVRRILVDANLPPIPLNAELSYGAGPPLTLVVLGDSTAQGIGASSAGETFGAGVARSLAEDGRAVRLHNLGVSGAQAKQVLSDQIPRVTALKPDLVLLSVGANDVTGWTSRGDYLQSMESILDGLAGTGARVVVLDVPAIVAAPLLPLPARWVFDVRTHRFNSGLRDVVGGRKNVELAPIYEETREPFERDRTNFAADGYHPSPKGYALWADVILRALGASR